MVFTRWHASVLVEMFLKRGDGGRVGWPKYTVLVCVCVHMCLCALLPPGHHGPSLVTTWLFSLAVPKISHTPLLIAC